MRFLTLVIPKPQYFPQSQLILQKRKRTLVARDPFVIGTKLIGPKQTVQINDLAQRNTDFRSTDSQPRTDYLYCRQNRGYHHNVHRDWRSNLDHKGLS